VTSIAFSRDGKLAASTGVSWKVIAWSLPSGKVILVGQHPDKGTGVRFTPDASRLVSIGSDWTLKVWDIKSQSCVATWEGQPGFYGVAISNDGKWATVGKKDKGREIIDVTTGKTIASCDFTGTVNALYASPEGSLVVWQGDGNLLKGWHVQSKKHVAVLDKHAAEVSTIAVSLDGTCVVSGAKDGTVGIWNAG
jgi:WD40 repeat protein